MSENLSRGRSRMVGSGAKLESLKPEPFFVFYEKSAL